MSDDWTKRCAREWHPHQRGEAEALAAHIRRHARQQCPHCYTTLFNAESDSESPEAVRPGAGCPTPPEPESLEAVVEREFVDIFTDYYQDSNKTFKPQAVMMARRLSEKLRPWLTARDLKQLEGQADYIRNLERERDALLKLVEDRARAIDKVCIERDEARETAKSLHGETTFGPNSLTRKMRKNIYVARWARCVRRWSRSPRLSILASRTR